MFLETIRRDTADGLFEGGELSTIPVSGHSKFKQLRIRIFGRLFSSQRGIEWAYVYWPKTVLTR